jgi:hypothetical protein
MRSALEKVLWNWKFLDENEFRITNPVIFSRDFKPREAEWRCLLEICNFEVLSSDFQSIEFRNIGLQILR